MKYLYWVLDVLWLNDKFCLCVFCSEQNIALQEVLFTLPSAINLG